MSYKQKRYKAYRNHLKIMKERGEQPWPYATFIIVYDNLTKT